MTPPRARARGAAVRAAALVVLLAAGAAAQDWRGPALAAFDEAWRTIHDTFYDPAFGGLDWKGVGDELRPRVESAASAEAARGVIAEMLARLGRSHFALLPASAGEAAGGEATVRVDVRLAAGTVVVTRVEPGSAAERAGLRPGDAILAVDGTAAAAWFEHPPAMPARARPLETWRRAMHALQGADGSRVSLRLRRVDGELDVSLPRERESGRVVSLGHLPPMALRVDTREATTPGGRRAGVVAFSLWMPAIDAPVAQAIDRFRAADGLVFDLRGNPGGLAEMMRGIAGHVLAEPLVLGRMQTRDARLEFRANPRRSTPDGRAVAPFAGPVAVLVDELTASTSECFAAGLQSLGRAHVVGRTSMGQALPALTRRLPTGDVLMYAIGDFVTSSGRRVEESGVVPDLEVPISVAALAAGRDPVLEAALAWIDGRGR